MKTKTSRTLAAISFAILACIALFSGASARACTVFCDSQGDTVLAGRSLDIPDNPNLGLQFVPATAKTHGYFCCGRFAYPWADGMNDHGLFVGVADVPTPHTTTSSRRSADLPTFLSGLLANCTSVDEAIAWCGKQPTPHLGGWVRHDFFGFYTFVTLQHVLVADRSGDSVVFEWPDGKLKTTRKKGRYQLMTNFLLCDPQAGNYPCPRFSADTKILENAAGPSLQTCRQVLKTTSVGTTRYSLICDLTHGDVQVYLRRNFDQPKTFHLADEVQKGRHEIDLDQWFGRSNPRHLSPPRVIALNSETYNEYVGQYRKSLLFGLLHLGPTLCVSHVTDQIGDHLVVSVRGLQATPADFFSVNGNSFIVDPNLTEDAIQLTFVRPRNGKTTRVIVNWNGNILSGARISDKPAG